MSEQEAYLIPERVLRSALAEAWDDGYVAEYEREGWQCIDDALGGLAPYRQQPAPDLRAAAEEAARATAAKDLAFYRPIYRREPSLRRHLQTGARYALDTFLREHHPDEAAAFETAHAAEVSRLIAAAGGERDGA